MTSQQHPDLWPYQQRHFLLSPLGGASAQYSELRKKAKTGFIYKKSKRVHARPTWKWAWPRLSASVCRDHCVLVELLIAQSNVPHSFLSLPVLVPPVVLTTHAQLWVRVHARVLANHTPGLRTGPRVWAWLLLKVNVTCLVTFKPRISLNFSYFNSYFPLWVNIIVNTWSEWIVK